MMTTYKERHVAALLNPETPEEQSIRNLLTELSTLADRYKGDQQAIPAVENIGSAILRLLNFPLGRLDQSTLDKQVREEVERAGGDAANL